jgi:cytochrome c-type biogenesis protein CcmF
MTFTGYRSIDNNTKYAFDINMKKGNQDFTISPVMYISEFNNGLMREPAILSMITKDFYVSPLGYDNGTADQSTQGQALSLKLGDQTNFDGAKITYTNFVAPDLSVMQGGGDFQMGVDLTILKDSKTYKVEALMKKEGRSVHFVPIELKDANLKIQLEQVDPATKNAKIIFGKLDQNNEAVSKPKEVLSISASTKPFVNLVWTGILIMVFGFFISVARRLKESLV